MKRSATRPHWVRLFAASLFAAAAVQLAHAQTPQPPGPPPDSGPSANGPSKHQANKAELKKLEQNGYQPGTDDPHYPQNIQNAERKAAKGSGASAPKANGQ